MAACSTYQYDAIFIIENLIASGGYERVSVCVRGYVRYGLLLETVLGVCFIISGLTFVKSEWAHNYWGKIVKIICYRFFSVLSERYNAIVSVRARPRSHEFRYIEFLCALLCSAIYSTMWQNYNPSWLTVLCTMLCRVCGSKMYFVSLSSSDQTDWQRPMPAKENGRARERMIETDEDKEKERKRNRERAARACESVVHFASTIATVNVRELCSPYIFKRENFIVVRTSTYTKHLLCRLQ